MPHHQLLGPLFVGMCWILFSSQFQTAIGQQDDTLPLWRQGISQFNGIPSSDRLVEPDQPTAPISGRVPIATSSQNQAPTYTVPFVPGFQPQVSSNHAFQIPGVNTSPGATPPAAAASTGSTGSFSLPAVIGANSQSSTQIAQLQDPPANSPSLSAPQLAAPIRSAPTPDDPPAAPLPAPSAEGEVIAEGPKIEELNESHSDIITVEEPPLQEEVIHWYHYPARWAKGWDSHAEFGIDGSEGNADTLAIQTGLELKRKTEAYTFAIDVDYRRASSRSVTTEENGRFNVDYDRLLLDSAWSAFGKLGLEWDQFKAFDLRVNLNAGAGYHWVRTKKASFVTRFGAGASREFGSPIDEWTAEAIFGIDAERQLTSRQKIKGKLDYFPSWEDFGDYRLVTDVSWEILLDGSENLSLKLGVNDRYDSTPQGAEPNDFYYSLLLLYKF